MFWIKIGKISLSNKSNTYIACVYNSPKNSTYTKENECNVLQLIVKQLAKFSELDQIIIGGGFNSRIGTKADFIVEDRKDLDFLPEGYELDTFTTHRNNEDVSLNSYGEQLIQLCVASKLRVLNGRTREDLQGHFIYLGYRGCSTVDFRKHFPNKLGTVAFSTTFYDLFRPQAYTTYDLMEISNPH